MRALVFSLIVAVAGLLPDHSANGNTETTVILHSRVPGFGCGLWESEFDCETTRPNTSVEPSTEVVVDVLLRNYESIGGFQGQFVVDPGQGGLGDWTFIVGVFACQSSQLSSSVPGPGSGDLVTTFECITGGSLAQLGWIRLVTGTTGCLTVDDFDFGEPIKVFGCASEADAPVAAQNRGRICIGPGGHDACDPSQVPVEAVTWGLIKSHYAR